MSEFQTQAARLAALIPSGELLAQTDQAEFVRAVAAEIERLRSRNDFLAQQVEPLREERDAVVDVLKKRSAEWLAASGSVADIVKLLLYQKDREIERLQSRNDFLAKQVVELGHEVKQLLAYVVSWKVAFQEAERRAGMDSVAVDPSSAFPLLERIDAMRSEIDQMRPELIRLRVENSRLRSCVGPEYAVASVPAADRTCGT